ncbi:MAG TPA: hypothetical protein VIC08_06080 [Cellvibrionaceae bacterium]
MRIISTSSEPQTLPHTSKALPASKLIKHHPAALLFDVTSLRRDTEHSTFNFKRSPILANTQGDIRATAGCLVDLAVRMAAEQAWGNCELWEYEMHICAPLTAKILQVRVDIESTTHLCATYSCAIYSLVGRKTSLLAESQGTFQPVASQLLKLR